MQTTQLRHAVLLAALAAAMGAPAQAQTGPVGVGYVGLPNAGIVHFFGRVRDAACTATVNGQGPTGYVILPDSVVGNFPNVGDTYGWTPFYIELSDCPKVAKLTAWPYFFAGHANSTTGRLNNIPGIGQATGIDLELTDKGKTPFKVYQGSSPFGSQGPTMPITATTHQIDYGVQYYRTGGINPGAVRSNVDYIVYYQ